MKSLPLAVLLPCAVLLAACDKAAPGGAALPGTALCGSTPSAGGASLATACAAYVDGLRAYGARCSATLTDFEGPAFAQYCTTVLSAPGSAQAAPFLMACGTRLRDLPCWQSLSDTCECSGGDDLRGTLPDGSPCLTELQCASGYCPMGGMSSDGPTCGKCTSPSPIGGPCGKPGAPTRCVKGSQCAYTPGICVAETIAKEGEPCASDGQRAVRCDTGLRCSTERADGGVTSVCKRPGGPGAPCGTCGGELRCVAGTCQMRGSAGAKCTSGSDCASDFTCGPDQLCVAIVQLTQGQTCGGSAGARCGPGFYCPSATGTPAVCTAYKALGEACTPQVDRCATFAVCLGGRCVIPDPAMCR